MPTSSLGPTGRVLAWPDRSRTALKDIAAVRAAIVSQWSNDQIEEEIAKLKQVSRKLYGRGKLDLLKAMLISAA